MARLLISRRDIIFRRPLCRLLRLSLGTSNMLWFKDSEKEEIMRRLLFVTLSVYFLSASAFAQQSNAHLTIPSPSQSTPSESQDFQTGQFRLRPPKIIPDLPYPPQFVQIPMPIDISVLKNIKEPEFKVINGAVYISILDQAIFIPMVGGGASGCLILDPPIQAPSDRHRPNPDIDK